MLSNRPLRKVPVTSRQNTPDVDHLGAAGVLIWMYYEVHGDPVIGDPERPPIPDYRDYSYPLTYSEAQVFPPLDYEWSSELAWLRLGHNLPATAQRPEDAALTVMVWKGVRASAQDVQAVKDIVKSVSVA